MQWDVLCRVIDNFGDVGVALRLARDLAQRGEQVRLWLDDTRALAWMAPQSTAGVEVLAWAQQAHAIPGDVVVETFGCDPEPAFIHAMAQRQRPPLWINLEYLSAEPFAQRCHGLASPVAAGPGRGLVKRFYYPGFTPASGGLIREPGLLARQAAFDATAWLASMGLTRRPGERVVSLFCYPEAPLAELLVALASQPTALLLAPGAAAAAVLAGRADWSPGVRALALPWLTQTDFDHLLWASDLNFVRGEDSFVRAQWAGRPFVWQIYPQHDGAHGPKLQAFLAAYLATAGAELATPLSRLFAAWNGLASHAVSWPAAQTWHAHALGWREQLAAQPDLTTRLLRFATESR